MCTKFARLLVLVHTIIDEAHRVLSDHVRKPWHEFVAERLANAPWVEFNPALNLSCRTMPEWDTTPPVEVANAKCDYYVHQRELKHFDVIDTDYTLKHTGGRAFRAGRRAFRTGHRAFRAGSRLEITVDVFHGQSRTSSDSMPICIAVIKHDTRYRVFIISALRFNNVAEAINQNYATPCTRAHTSALAYIKAQLGVK